ncbi:MAG: undecaprenyl-diphosphate phosphatase [Alphaproteobacteria bacterium]
MSIESLWQVLLLGAVEGLTEFLPVSSTGHLILLVDMLGVQTPPGKIFEICIQLGAILAICVVYFRKLWKTTMALPKDAKARRFFGGLVIAFIPAAILGALLGDFVKNTLFNPWVVCSTLVLGGVAMLVIEKKLVQKSSFIDAWELPMPLMLKIGLCQSIALIPGVSRSGATIMGGMMLGVDRKAATEFSFFLALPTMIGATLFALYKARHEVDVGDMQMVAIGFLAAFVVALLVVRFFITIIKRFGFSPFAWYRIAFGFLMAALLIARDY